MSDYGSLIISVQPADDLDCWWVVIVEIVPGSGRYLAQNTCTKVVAYRPGPPGLPPGSPLPEPDPHGIFPGDFLRLEQAEYDKDVDPCAPTGVLEVKVYVYRSRDDLVYRITTSHGHIGGGSGGQDGHGAPPTNEDVNRVVQISVNMVDSVTIADQISGSAEFTWQGQVLDVGGEPINPPTITRSGNTLSWGGERVLGTIQAKYQTSRTVHILTLPQRSPFDTDEDDDSTTYAATVTAVWGDGQYTTLGIEPPEMKGKCRVIINPPEDDDEDCYRLIKTVDPCTGEVISERTESMECPEDPEEDPEEE